MEEEGFSEVYVINEYYITLDTVISNEEADIIENEVQDFSADYRNQKLFIPDNFVSGVPNDYDLPLPFFIEYKVGNNFEYIKLANDFLKYKYYTLKADSNSVFIYIIFNPIEKGLKPTLILNTESYPIIQKIENHLSETGLNEEASFFIFETTPKENISVELYKTSNKLDLITKYIDKIEDLDIAFSEITDFEQNAYYLKQHIFGVNVMIAKRIRREFQKIKSLYESIEQKENLLTNIPDQSYFSSELFSNEDNIDIEVFIMELARHFNNEIRVLPNEKRKQIQKNKFNYISKKSLWVLLLIQKYASDNNLDYSYDNFESEEEREAFNEDLEKLDQAYFNQIEKFNQLAIGLIVYIVKLYDVLFIENEDNQLILKEQYEAFKIKKKLIENIKKIQKLLRIEEISIDWSFDIKNTGMEIANQIIKNLLNQ